MTATAISIPESFETQLHNIFVDIADNNNFCFHSIDPSFLFPDLSSLKGQNLIFNEQYSDSLDLNIFTVRYTIGCNIIFRSLDVLDPWLFLNTFRNILFHITTVLVCISSNTNFVDSSISSTEINLPLLKLVIYPGHDRDINIKLLCNDYCKDYSETLHTTIIRKFINDPIGSHKLYFWNANQRVVPAAIFARYWIYFEPDVYGNDRFACSRLVMKSLDMAFCTYEILGTLTLAKVHNISIIPYSKLKASEFSMIDTSNAGQYILTSVRYLNYKELFYYQQTRLQFSTYGAKRAVYCLIIGEHKSTINFSIWLNPFQFEIWIIVCIFLIVLPLPSVSITYSVNQLLDNLLNDLIYMFGIFFRAGIPIHINKRIAFISVSFLGVFVCGVYENVILSQVVLSPKPTEYVSLASILSDGYKIIWFNKTAILRPEQEFQDTFLLLHLNHLLNSSFHEIKAEMPSFRTTALYVVRKYLTFSDESNLPLLLPLVENLIKLNTGKIPRCFTLPELINRSPSFWEIYTVNIYWLMKSIMVMRESGLTEKWDHWASWANKLESRLFVERNHNSDTIDLYKLSFPLLIYAGICSGGMIVFVCEALKFSCK